MSTQNVDTIRNAYEEFAHHVFELRDGKVVRFENKPDDAEAWARGWGG